MTNIIFWHILMLVTDRNFINMQKNEINILLMSATPNNGHQLKDVTKITVTVTKLDERI